MLCIVKRKLIIMTATWLIALVSGVLITSIVFKISNILRNNNSKLDNIQYVVLILSDSDSEEKRYVIRDTWFNLINNIRFIDHIPIYEWSLSPNGTVIQERPVKIDWLYNAYNITTLKVGNLNLVKNMIGFYFVIGVRGMNSTKLMKLQYENKANNDLLMLDKVDNKYRSLSFKVLESLLWVNKNLKGVKYVVKCDDDSFVRIDLIVRDLAWYAPLMKAPVLREFITYKDNRLDYKGLYWGYFTGNARIQSEGRWSENNWFLCDRYLPYALGGGYVISKSIVDYVAENVEHLSKYTCEDASMGVWTAPLNIKRVHDIRFESGHMTRRCDNNVLVRHKLSLSETQEMYNLLLLSRGKTLCVDEYLGKSYLYLWGRAPSQCCGGYVW